MTFDEVREEARAKAARSLNTHLVDWLTCKPSATPKYWITRFVFEEELRKRLAPHMESEEPQPERERETPTSEVPSDQLRAELRKAEWRALQLRGEIAIRKLSGRW